MVYIMLFENGELLIKKIFILATILMHSAVASGTSLEAGESAMVRGHYGTAMRALLPLANDGNIDAQAYIGYLYEKGLGVIQNYGTAIEWYKKAGSKGSFQAQHSLGMLYFTGEGISLNHPLAYEWFIKASEHNFPPSLYMLGLMYHQGHSVDINFERARVWFLKAAKLLSLIHI